MQSSRKKTKKTWRNSTKTACDIYSYCSQSRLLPIKPNMRLSPRVIVSVFIEATASHAQLFFTIDEDWGGEREEDEKSGAQDEDSTDDFYETYKAGRTHLCSLATHPFVSL